MKWLIKYNIDIFMFNLFVSFCETAEGLTKLISLNQLYPDWYCWSMIKYMKWQFRRRRK